MNKVNLYSIKGTKVSEFSLPGSVKAEENMILLAQAIRIYNDRSHTGLAKTKTRSEINRTKKKVYRQKGTGGARHGARSAPIYVGGGIAHGPQPLRRELNLPKVMAAKGLQAALAFKFKANQIVAAEDLSKIKKTKDAFELIKKIQAEMKSGKVNKVTFVLSDQNKEVVRYLRNLKNTVSLPFKNLNAFNVYFGGLVILDRDIFEKEVKKEEPKKKAVKKVTKEEKK